jgi:ABC-type multidrug transport system ATPase subunit
MVTIQNISKSFRELKALDNISIDIPEKCIFGFVGPDGAGKTTLFRIITTLLIPDHGAVLVDGLDSVRDYKKIRAFIGYMPGRFSLYMDLTVEENLNFYATIFSTTLSDNYRYIQSVYSYIEPFKKRLARHLSGGMKQKLALSCALIHHPRLLVLDEPTTGVDAVSRKEFWELLRNLQNEGMTIIVSTPYMDEAEKCDEIALMHRGKSMTKDKPENIKKKYKGLLFAVTGLDPYRITRDLRSYKEGTGAYLFGQTVHFTINADLSEKTIIKYLNEKGNKNIDIRKIQPSIEDCFIDAITGTGEEKQN